MGDVGNFLFGGSKEQQNSSNSSQQSSNSSSNQSSANRSLNASVNGSNNYQQSSGAGYNQAYAPVANAMTPALGYTAMAGNAMASLLGLPQTTFSYAQQPYSPPASSRTPSSSMPSLSMDSLSKLISQIPADYLKAPIPAPVPISPPTPTTPPTSATPPASTAPISSNISGGTPLWSAISKYANLEPRADGGPVQAGQGYIVGEKQPEVFVPHTNGFILPRAPGMGPDNRTSPNMSAMFGFNSNRHLPKNNRTITPTTSIPPVSTPNPATPPPPPPQEPPQYNPTVDASSGLNSYANSAGMNFILDQGQKAVSGASAANGVFNSGATGQALTQYGQNLGQTYLDNYMKYLQNYGNLGLGAASALSGSGGVTQNSSAGGGTSRGSSIGASTGTSTGTSTSTSSGSSSGTGTSSGNSKKGLIPDLALFKSNGS